MPDQRPQSDQTPERTGGEKKLRDELQGDDPQFGHRIEDRPLGNREQRRRSINVDLHGDEDNDPKTDEGRYRRKQQEQER